MNSVGFNGRYASGVPLISDRVFVKLDRFSRKRGNALHTERSAVGYSEKDEVV